jgi:hypothetical protein
VPLERFVVPHGAPPVVVSGAPHGPGDDPFRADPKAVAAHVAAGGVVPAPKPTKSAPTTDSGDDA